MSTQNQVAGVLGSIFRKSGVKHWLLTVWWVLLSWKKAARFLVYVAAWLSYFYYEHCL